ncbi:hypothetical protein L596_000929 [Steinernema carpocapsae]|uniref:MADF domain-containing protein n=1 Tax=Steinernema carpocapsae TaxID=34508 RepID=A0A4U8UNS1_STECR|nr:hypothetical protein L596_000929 [Steinernema carpocapsae]
MAVATAVASTSLDADRSSHDGSHSGDKSSKNQRVNLPLFNERLIEEVEKYPVLYDQSQRNCMDNDERVKIWDDIARAVDPAVKGTREDASRADPADQLFAVLPSGYVSAAAGNGERVLMLSGSVFRRIRKETLAADP